MLSFLSISPGGGEVLLIFMAVLILFGAKNVPRMARRIGHTLEDLRRATREVTHELMRADLEEDEKDQPAIKPDEQARERSDDESA